jgi:photosystem II stability/assembly factor-like uncharacterized protein
MRGKVDQRLERRRSKAKPYKRPYGGKVLQRLFEYLDQRSATMSAEAVATLGVPQSVQRALGFVDSKPPRSKAARGAKSGKKSPRARAKKSSRARTQGGAKRYAAAIAKVAAALAPQHAAAAPGAPAGWQPLGPTAIPNGQTYGTNKIGVIGRVSSIAVDPSNSSHLLLGAAGGGIWESTDTGATWAARTDQMPSNAIGAIAFDPTDPRRVYAGSGEGNFYFNLGAGVYGSTDGGTTWSVLAQSPFVGWGFFELVVDPKDPSILYAATIDPSGKSGGFYRSANGGTTWLLKRAGICWSISVHPNGGTVELLVAFEDGLFVSSDTGNSFQPVALPTKPSGPWKRLSVARVASAPDVAYLFGAIETAPYLWRRSAGNWTRITSLPPVDRDRPWTGQAAYDWYVAAAPDNEAQIYLGAIDLYRGTLSGSTWRFKDISTQGANSIHPDQHCLAFSPDDPKVIYAGSDGGLFRSPDRGATWAPLNSGLAISEIEYIAADPNTSQWLMTGTQDNGTVRFTGSAVWDQIAEGDGGDCGVNPANPNEVYHSFYCDPQTGLLGFESSTNKGKTWSPRDVNIESAMFYPPVEVSGSTVAIGATAVFLSRDKAVHWDKKKLGFPSNDWTTAMDLIDPNTLVVGTYYGRCARLDWSAAGWKVTALTSPTQRYISGLRVGPTNTQRVWVTIQQMPENAAAMVYRSDDGGKSWNACRNGLPALPMNAVAIDPADANRAWVAADLGVYETRDGGANWTSVSGGLPNVMAADLLYHAKARKLICGTRNRGTWALNV